MPIRARAGTGTIRHHRHPAKTVASTVESAAVCDISQHWSGTLEWLKSLKRLVEVEVAFSALKFANYLEAERQLFRRMPELRSVCQEARRLCRCNPRISSQVAARIDQLQSTWLAIETRLSEFKSQRSLLTALSGDLKQLETCQGNSSSKENERIAADKHVCCTRKIELLDGVVQKKQGQLQRMLSVTSVISQLLDWVSNNELLAQCANERAAARTPTASASTARSPAVDNSSTSAATPRGAVELLSVTTGSTNYQRTQSNTDGDQGDPMTSDSSEILAQAGFNVNASFNNDRIYQNDNNNVLLLLPDCDAATGSQRSNLAKNGAANYFNLSPLLLAVSHRVAALKSSIETVQASLEAEAQAAGQEASGGMARELYQLAVAEATLNDRQNDLASLRAGVLAAVASAPAAGPEEAIFRRAYLESIALLANWTASLRDRCRSKLLALN